MDGFEVVIGEITELDVEDDVAEGVEDKLEAVIQFALFAQIRRF